MARRAYEENAAPRFLTKKQGVNKLVKENVVLQMKNIHKNFTGVKALQAVDFSLREGRNSRADG